MRFSITPIVGRKESKMKFYIFGTKDHTGSEFRFKIKDNLSINPNAYQTTLNQYIDLTNSRGYTDIFFVVDFGNYKPFPFKYVSENDIHHNILPFLIIGEYHFGYDLIWKDNKTAIYLHGFREEFNTNKAALEKFLTIMYSNYVVLLTTKYKDDNGIIQMAHVTNSLSVFKDKYKIKRFLFDKR